MDTIELNDLESNYNAVPTEMTKTKISHSQTISFGCTSSAYTAAKADALTRILPLIKNPVYLRQPIEPEMN